MTDARVDRRTMMRATCGAVAGVAGVDRVRGQRPSTDRPHGRANSSVSNHGVADVDPTYVTKLSAADGAPEDQFGHAVAVDGETAIVGARQEGDDGAAYVFSRVDGTWKQQQKLTIDGSDSLGFAVALQGETALIGTSSSTETSAYVFSRTDDEWRATATLSVDDSVNTFGWSVALDDNGNRAVVGGAKDETPQGDVFVRSDGSWNHEGTVDPDTSATDLGAGTVAMAGETILVGAWWEDTENGEASGSVYAFERDGDTWVQDAELVPTDGHGGEIFGWAVELTDDTALIGARGSNAAGEGAGAVYVFTRTNGTWQQQRRLTAIDAQRGDQFGWSIARQNDTAVVGAAMDATTADATGSAYVFSKADGSWGQEAKLTANDGDEGDLFGFDVALDDGVAVVGALHDDQPNGEESGSAYVFDDVQSDAQTAVDDADSTTPTSSNSTTTSAADTTASSAGGDTRQPPGNTLGLTAQLARSLLSTEALLVQGAAVLAAIIWAKWPNSGGQNP